MSQSEILCFILIIMILIRTRANAQQACKLTDPDILGPYYLPDAPRSNEQLCLNGPENDRLILVGQVVDYDSNCRQYIPYVKLDLWQANSYGVYSSGKDENDWFCRAIFYTDKNGYFRITTLIPGRYKDNGRYRPAHIHFNITAKGYPKLITQLYFKEDYYLYPKDSCIECHSSSKSLKVSATHRNDIKTFYSNWTIVLSKYQRIHYSSDAPYTKIKE